jgi:hypothetical protein
VQAICGDDRDPAIAALAYKIAENRVLLSDIAMQKVAVVERLREPYANAFSSKDNSLQLAAARALQAWLGHREITAKVPALLQKYELRLMVETLAKSRDDYVASLERDLAVLFPDEKQRAAIIEERVQSWVERETARLKAQGWRLESDDIVPIRLKALLDEAEEMELSVRTDQGDDSVIEQFEGRDEYEAVEAAALDLMRLERYEQRTWSRQKRVILQLTRIRLERRFDQTQVVPA